MGTDVMKLGALALAAAWAGALAASNVVSDGVRTISNELVAVAAESDLDGDGQTADRVVLAHGGGVAFTQSVSSLKKVYTLDGTGVVSVAADQTVKADGANLAAGAVGHTLVKRGGGTFSSSRVHAPAAARTRIIVEEGMFHCRESDFWGNHATANTNVTIDVREGAVWHNGSLHSVVGPVELTGGTFQSAGGSSEQWSDAAFCGGLVAHAAATPSRVLIGYKGFAGHCAYTNCVVAADAGATLLLDGTLRDGYNAAASARVPCRVVARGAGVLYLLRPGEWTGGTFLEGGRVVVGVADALGAGDVVVAGDVTLEVARGVRLDLSRLRVQGAHTLTLAGDGAAVLPQPLPEGLTVAGAATGAVPSPVVDGILSLNGAVVTVDVPEGETVAVTGASAAPLADGLDAARTHVVKTGGGTLALPSGLRAAYGALTVREGRVSVADESSFGSGGVTVADGAGLQFRSSFTQGFARLAFEGDATLDIPSGVTFSVHPNLFACSGRALTKTGGGVWRVVTRFTPALAAGSRWIVHEGALRVCASDVFANSYSEKTALALEIHEGAVLETETVALHVPVGDVVLRGGTLRAGYAQFDGAPAPLEVGAKWRGFGLNGTVTVLPSADGRPSRLKARACHAGHADAATGAPFETTFDVREGATFEVDAMLCPGRAADGPCASGLVKDGAGVVRFLKSPSFTGALDVRGGTVALAPGVSLGACSAVRVDPAAQLVLDDGARLTAPLGAENASCAALCASAALWLDASRIRAQDGARVASVPNLGTCGGAFAQATERPEESATLAGAPVFSANGINGLGSLAFNGEEALVTAAYTNTGAAASVFLVARWTSWQGTGGKGRWGGPVSLSARDPAFFSSETRDDNHIYGGLSYQHSGETSVDLFKTLGGLELQIENVGLAVGAPYLAHSWRDGGLRKGATSCWLPGAYQCVTGDLAGGASYDCQINRVCVGGRLRNGAPQVFGDGSGQNRMFIGEIGEMLVFSRRLEDAERGRIEVYLRNKWFNAGEAFSGDRPPAGVPARIVVPDGARADLVVGGGAQADGTARAFTKDGGGTLRCGGAAAGGLAMDVAAGTLALAPGRLASRVDVWADAADAAARTLDAEGRVTNLVNKGAAGGAFRLSARAKPERVPAGPLLKEAGLNGRAVLAFDGDACLALESYTNRAAPRALSVYLVARRTKWETTPDAATEGVFGKWASAFSLARVTAENSEHQLPGAVHVSENEPQTAFVDLGGTGLDVATPPTGEPYLFVLHSLSNGCFIAYETNATDVAAVPRTVTWSDYGAEPCDIDLVHLGARIRNEGQPQWFGKGNANNRCWFGDVGEFIVTTQPLTDGEEAELFAYLRAKWLGKGDGAVTPPEWLAGTPATPVTDAETTLAMADGTCLEHAAATLALGALETAGAVDWARAWSGGDAADFPLFSVAGDVALGAVRLAPLPLPKADAKVLDWTGALDGGAAWTLDGASGGVRVNRRGRALWLVRTGTLLLLR